MSRVSRLAQREADLRFAVYADEQEALKIIHGKDIPVTQPDGEPVVDTPVDDTDGMEEVVDRDFDEGPVNPDEQYVGDDE